MSSISLNCIQNPGLNHYVIYSLPHYVQIRDHDSCEFLSTVFLPLVLLSFAKINKKSASGHFRHDHLLRVCCPIQSTLYTAAFIQMPGIRPAVIETGVTVAKVSWAGLQLEAATAQVGKEMENCRVRFRC